MLYRPEVFEPLTDEPWSEGRVSEAIARIVAEADDAYTPAGLWPADEWDAWTSPVPMKNLYVGAAGVIWALDGLRRRGHAETSLDLAEAAQRTLEAWGREPDFPTGLELPSEPEAGFMTGKAGILLVAWGLAPSPELADELLDLVRRNVRNEATEIMWGSPGTMLVAGVMLDATGEERWREAWRESADALWAARDGEGLWTQRLYGAERRSLTPPHGLVGNTLALLGGADLLAGERHEALRRDTAAIVTDAAVFEDGLANWPTAAGGELVGGDGEIRVQWCAGAPGMVIATASYLDDELLRAGAELAWHTGPPGLDKGPSICHGTAGNGYAFLKVWNRTGDERWLERARRFAMHALGQVERAKAERGRGRYSLWTGDLGAALYAADCLDDRAAYPVIDGFDW